MSNRQYDIIVWGATGYSGRLICEYLGEHKSSFSWAIAGRDGKRLEEIKQYIATKNGKKVDVLVADAKSEQALNEVAAKTKVIVACVGPFLLYGEPILKACIANGTDYCDITGEVPWVSDMIAKYGQQAADKKIRIINNAGFDSVPSDIGTYFAVQELKKRGHSCRQVDCLFTNFKGSPSGGSFATMMIMRGDPIQAKKLSDVHLLAPASVKPSTVRYDEQDHYGCSYNKNVGMYTAPFVMATVNSRIVRRTAGLFALDKQPYGANFLYNECMAFKSACSALAVTAFIAFRYMVTQVKPLANFLSKFTPKSGDGPNAEARAKNSFTAECVAYSEQQNKKLVATFKGQDGYSETAHYTAEVALALAFDRDTLPPRYGFVTPAYAMGDVLLQRLKNTGTTIEVASFE